jgi:hypothetical protein
MAQHPTPATLTSSPRNAENEPDPLPEPGAAPYAVHTKSSAGGQPPHKGETPEPEVSVPSVQE